ncbi:MAG: hypothetical protein M3Z24_09255 [Chloroflexota bacterium]|nr:hypothetical protein [Chloroflexota bacterium]
MPEDRQSRIDKLSQRFKQHGVGRKPTVTRTRIHRSFYLDADVVEELDKVYRELNHTMHPKSVSKSVFLETALDYAFAHITEIQASLETAGGQGDTE